MVRVQCPHSALAAPAPWLSSPSVHHATIWRFHSATVDRMFISRPCFRSFLPAIRALLDEADIQGGVQGGVCSLLSQCTAILILPWEGGGGVRLWVCALHRGRRCSDSFVDAPRLPRDGPERTKRQQPETIGRWG